MCPYKKGFLILLVLFTSFVEQYTEKDVIFFKYHKMQDPAGPSIGFAP